MTTEHSPHAGDTYLWTQPDNAVIYVRISKVSHRQAKAWLVCHHGGRSWTSRQPLPLRPSIRKASWTTDDLLGSRP